MQTTNTPAPAFGWVRGSVLNTFKGYTADMLKRDKTDGLLIEDKHFIKDDKNRVWWNYEEMDKLIESKFKH